VIRHLMRISHKNLPNFTDTVKMVPVRNTFNVLLLSCALWSAYLTSSCFAHCNLTTVVLCPSIGNNCGEPVNDSYINLVYTTVRRTDDIVHFLYSTRGVPSVLVAHTSPSATLHINFTKFLSHNVTEAENSITFNTGDFTVQPNTSFVLLIEQLIDFKDSPDTAKMGDTNWTTVHNLSRASWRNVSLTKDVHQHLIVFNGTPSPWLSSNGSFGLQFRSFCDSGYSPELPKLPYNSQMTSVDVVMDNVATQYNESRFGLKLVVATTSHVTSNMSMDVRKSIDDEHSPGSFVTINWLTSSNESESESFLQWKPACYNQPQRSIKSLSSARYYEITPYHVTQPAEPSLALDYFGHLIYDSEAVKMATNDISFGLAHDGFYKSTHFAVWSFSLGIGKPPFDVISPTIVLIIAIGLGIPVVIILAGIVYTCVRKCRTRREGYEEITGSYSEIN
jgi:hypothetical protein